MPDVDFKVAPVVAYDTGVYTLVIKDDAPGLLLLGSASARGVGTDPGQIPFLDTNGLLPASVIPGGGGAGNGLPTGGTPGQIIINTASGTGAWATFTYSGSSIVTALQAMDTDDIQAYQVSMYPTLSAGDIPVVNADEDGFEPLDIEEYTAEANVFLYMNDDAEPVYLSHTELAETLAPDGACVVSSESGAVSLTFRPGQTDFAGWRTNLTGSITLNAVPGLREGRAAPWWIVQDATGSRTLTLGAGVQWLPGSEESINTAANARTLLVIIGGDDNGGTEDADVYVSVAQSLS